MVLNPYSEGTDDRIYTMYDTVHLFKNVYFNLLNKKNLLCPPFPGSESPMNVMFSHLIQLFNMEYGAEAKMAYKLTDKVLHPSNIERVNVQLAISATHETTTAALDYFGQKEEYSAFKQRIQADGIQADGGIQCIQTDGRVPPAHAQMVCRGTR